MATVVGNGVNVINNPSLKNRAKRKSITQALCLALVDVAKKNGDVRRQQSFWNAYHCQNRVLVSDNKLYTNYCKNRFCTVCCAIRKANMINRYYPTIKTWEEPYFVTLTVKACTAKQLNRMVIRMFRAFELIHDRCKKRYQRGKGIKLIGIKALECNFNSVKRTYNPHFHLVVSSKEVAELLVSEWIKQWRPTSGNKYKYANPVAQKISKITNLEASLIETIKYGSKVFNDPDMKKDKGKGHSPLIYVNAMYNILVAFEGRRLFERFGFNLPKQDLLKSQPKLVSNVEEFFLVVRTPIGLMKIQVSA